MGGRHVAPGPPRSWRSYLGMLIVRVPPAPWFAFLLESWERTATGQPASTARVPLRMIEAGPARVVRPRPSSDAITTGLRVGDVTIMMGRFSDPTVVDRRAITAGPVAEPPTDKG